ncbi:MAG: tRNA (uridine(34)/cytosine(34)/5-carboxymethylaminomethyluridine(34)-2'-O)-methyltransferase TrmL [Deltaproteobacteria bacterium]|jgi:tRNA (cytidine/uridine-2'-O-)-methyltransferase|nr:tRNA (uridine(34)/cytosine(34)/5-carboxymethylaminomethyluridine(34)-2'-O)-methyltransferase TrmL [Deltaproteobacteria bacterium]
MEIILFEPEIPPNTGNIARLTAGLSLKLNLIQPLGFSLDEKSLKRAGLDYWPLVELRVFPDWPAFVAQWGGGRLVGTSARSGSHFATYSPKADDGLVFGPETRGLPTWLVEKLDLLFNIPLKPGVRSLNLASATAFFLGIALSRLYEPSS